MTRSTERTLREPPSPSEVAYYVAVARQQRATFIARQARHAGQTLRKWGRDVLRRSSAARGNETAAPAEVVLEMRDPLAAIRSSAEILRDNPGMSPSERARFLGILLSEEQRLEKLLAAIGTGAPRAVAQ